MKKQGFSYEINYLKELFNLGYVQIRILVLLTVSHKISSKCTVTTQLLFLNLLCLEEGAGLMTCVDALFLSDLIPLMFQLDYCGSKFVGQNMIKEKIPENSVF